MVNRTATTSPAADAHHPPATPAARRKGATACREWLVVTAAGGTHVEDAGKHTIMRRTGLPARDLRVLDPVLSYPSTILGRDRAIVINLEHIKAVITAAEVLVPNSKEPMVEPFVQELQSRVAAQATCSFTTDKQVVGNVICKPHTTLAGCLIGEMSKCSPGAENFVNGDGGTKVVPFEFKALEVCLESACRCLDSEASTLEQEAYPALDELTSKVSTLNLERVRKLKSRLVAVSGRVQKVRDELEHLLDDDTDMAEMYLTEKLVRQPASESSSRVDIDTDAPELDEDGDEDVKTEIESRNGSLGGFKPNIEELEMLLEAYFVQIDSTLNKLSTLREYIDDTEDYINIMLDDKQNQLLQMGTMLSTANLVMTAGIAVTGVFGINITISLFNAPTIKFWETTVGTVSGCVVLYILAVGWGKRSGILQ